MPRQTSATDLSSLWSRAKRRARLALPVFAVAFAATAGIAQFLPDLYESQATVVIERPQVADTAVGGGGPNDLETRLQTIREQVLSRARLWALIEKLDLYADVRHRAPQEAVVGQMRKDVTIEYRGIEQRNQPGWTTAFAIGYRGRDPQKVADVANALAQASVEENQARRTEQTRGTAEFLRAQLDQVKARIDAQERRVSGYKMRYSDELSESRETAMNTLQRLSFQLDRNIDSQERTRDRLALLDRPVATGGRADVPETDEQRLVRLRAERADLTQRFTEKYPDVVALSGEIEALERKLRASPPRQAADDVPEPGSERAALERRQLQGELKRLQDEERRLRPMIGDYQGRLENMPKRDVELQSLSADTSSLRDQYETLLKRYTDASLAERVEERQRGETLAVLDPAVTPKLPVAPNRQRLLMMALLFSLGLAVAAVLVADRFDTTFHSVDDVRSFTTLPILVAVPRIVSHGDRVRQAAWAVAATSVLLVVVGVVVFGSYVFAHENEALVRMVAR
jgi:succinoglycan biosynthesis transport protein ExoP